MKTYAQMALVSVVAVLVVSIAVAVPVFFLPAPALPAPAVRANSSWQTENDFGVGIANADVIGSAILPSGTSHVTLQGNVSILSWHRFQGGGGNATGNCNAPTPAPGVCNVFLGVWTPNAWSAFASGGSADPLWCYSTNGSGCTNASAFSFTSSDLSSSDGAAWEIVLWNLSPWGVWGFVNVTQYQAR